MLCVLWLASNAGKGRVLGNRRFPKKVSLTRFHLKIYILNEIKGNIMTYIIARRTSVNTTACNKNPIKEGHPLLSAMRINFPKSI